MIPSPQSAGLPATWARLHPASPLVRSGRLIPALVFLVLVATNDPHPGAQVAREMTVIVVLALAVVGGLINWMVTRWRVSGGSLQIETGLIFRRSYRIPMDRIQGVDIVAPLLARMLGLAEVRVISAGGGVGQGRLAYLTAAQADAVRGQLLALSHGLAPETPPPPAHSLATVSNERLVWSVVLQQGIPLAIFIAAALIVVSVLPGGGDPTPTIALGSALVTMFIALGQVASRRVLGDFNYTLFEAPDGLRLHRGLLQTSRETIPYRRIQGIRLDQPLFWRPFGWYRLEVDVARQRVRSRSDEESVTGSSLMPVTTLDEAVWLISRIFPGAFVVPPQGAHPPARAQFLAPLSYHYLAAWTGRAHLMALTGRVRSRLVIVPFEKIQAVRHRQGPLLRLFRLATLRVDTAGRRWSAGLICRDASEAQELLWNIADSAAHARRNSGVVQPGGAAPAPGGHPLTG